MATVTSRGYTIRYESEGAGPPLMLVSGFTQWADQWVTAKYVAGLAEQFRVIRIDPLGHGFSDKPHDSDAYRWTDVIADLIAVADAENLQQPMWWGFSRGAFMVQDLAHLHPTRAGAVVLGSPVQSFGTNIDFDWLTLGEQLRAGDCLDQLWAALGFTDTAGAELGKSINDCEALACVFEGQYIEDFPDYQELVQSVLAYKGTLEDYHPQAAGLLTSARADSFEVANANHSDTFERSVDVLPAVIAFLTNCSATT
jgi:pimeloyl-ACP methyl ester carboxylesterase